MEKKINMESWHFKLYKKMMGRYVFISKNRPHYVNRCTYLKSVLKGIFWEIFKVFVYIWAVAVMSAMPFIFFHGFMTNPMGMQILTLVVLWILLSWMVISIKRKVCRYLRRFEPVQKVDEGFIDLKDLITGLFSSIKDSLCPMWVAVHPDYKE